MITYNKLVRDKIIDIIHNDGKECDFTIVENENLTIALQHKLREELKEYEDAKSDKEALEELADVVEVISALAKQHGYSFDDVLIAKTLKKDSRGGFEKGIILQSVE